MGIFFNDRSFEYETIRALSYTPARGAELGEVKELCKRIEIGNFESWYQSWYDMAKKLTDHADELIRLDHLISARDVYLRSSNYYRNAEFFLDKEDERRLVCYGKSVETFQTAMALMSLNCEVVSIPYEDYHMNGYYYFTSKEAPTLLFIGGYDSIAEELYFAGGFAAIERGYNLLIFDGPGQGGVLRNQKKVAEYQFEKTIAAAIDFLESTNRVVSESFIGLLGMSLGGYYSARAAAFEKRIDACILFDVFTDVWHSIARKNPDLVANPTNIENRDSYDRWMVANGLWVFGGQSIPELKEIVEKFDVLPVAANITCPLLLQYGVADIFVTEEQLTTLEEKLTCDFTVQVFDETFGGQEHCRAGNITLATQVMFDWLDTKVKGR